MTPSRTTQPVPTPTAPVEDSVAKIDNEIAVGEDLQFQRRWWRFEAWVWRLFALIVVLDLLGAFGRGPLSHAHLTSSRGDLSLNYERVERFNTPSILTIHFAPSAVADGHIRLWVSDSIVKRLGNQRIIPQPESSTIVDDGILYSFAAASAAPGSVAFALQPADVGSSPFALRLVSHGSLSQPQDVLQAKVFVMP